MNGDHMFWFVIGITIVTIIVTVIGVRFSKPVHVGSVSAGFMSHRPNNNSSLVQQASVCLITKPYVPYGNRCC